MTPNFSNGSEREKFRGFERAYQELWDEHRRLRSELYEASQTIVRANSAKTDLDRLDILEGGVIRLGGALPPMSEGD